MAIEQDELKLTVALDDQASAGLGNLQNSLRGIVTAVAPAQAGLAQLGKSLSGAGSHAKGLHGSLGGLAARGGFVAGFFSEIGRQVEQMVKQFAEAVTDLKGYADTMVKLDQVSSRAAQSMGQFRSNVAVFRESGVGEEQASKMLSGYANALAELQRPGNRLTQDLLRGQAGPYRERMEDLIRTITTSSQTQGINAIRQAGRQIRQEQERRGKPELGAQAEASFFARLGMPGLENVRGHLHEISAEEERMYNDRRKDAERYQTALEKQSDAWQRTVESAQAIAFELLPIASGAEQGASAFNYVKEGVQALERAMRNVNNEIDKQRAEEARKKVVTPEGKEITAQEGLSEDEKRKEILQRRYNPRRTTTTREGETLPTPDEATPGGGTYKTPLPTGGKYGMDIEFDPLANAPKRYRPGGAPGYRRAGLLGGEVDTGGGGMSLASAAGSAVDLSSIPSIGELLKPDPSKAIKVEPDDFAGTGWRGLPMSKNLIDLRGDKTSGELAYLEEQKERMGLLTGEVNTLNEYLAPELMRMLLAGTGAPDFHNAPMGGAAGESNPVQLPPGIDQPGGGASAEARDYSAAGFRGGREAAADAGSKLRSGVAGSVDQALKMVGLNEKKDQAILKEYMQTGGRGLTSDQNAWCARYVNAINVNAGLPSLESVVGAESAWSSRAFEKWGNKVDVGKGDTIQPGDVLVKARGNDPNKGHVGVATGNYRVNEAGVTEYEMLSGNIGGEKTIPGTNLPAQGGGVGLTYETIGGKAGGESAPGAGKGGVISVRRGERPIEVAETGPQEGEGKGKRLDAPQQLADSSGSAAMVAQRFAGGAGALRTQSGEAYQQPALDTSGLGIPNPQAALESMQQPDLPNMASAPDLGTGWRGLPLSGNVEDRSQDNYDPGTGLPLSLWRNPPTLSQLHDPQTGERIGESGSPLKEVYWQQGNAEVGRNPGFNPGAELDKEQPDGSVLDRATASQIDVNQSGRLSVDVNAPAGTTVSAEGGGVFNQTETNRSVPMEPAEAE